MLGMMALAIKILIPGSRASRAARWPRPDAAAVRPRGYAVAVALGLPFDELRPSPPARRSHTQN